MKNQKWFTRIYLVGCLTMLLCVFLNAQEMIVNGTFDSDEGWTVYDMGGNTPSIADFAVDDGSGPAAGEGPYLELVGEDTYTNIFVFQALTLEAGTTYELSGAFKDLTEGDLIDLWCEIYISDEEPVDGVDYKPPNEANTDKYISFSTWDYCAAGIDGTFQDDGCVGYQTPYYTPPGNPGEEVTIYLGIKAGVYADYSTFYDIAIDNISLIVEGSSAVAQENESLEGFTLYSNYPNPFNPTTTLRFTLPVLSRAILSVYDINGRLVRKLMNENLTPDTYSLDWDGKNDRGDELPSGVYLSHLQAGKLSQTQRMILMK